MKNRSDCEVLLSKAEGTFSDFAKCLENMVDEKKKKRDVAKSLFRFGASLTKLTLSATGCAIKNAPKVVVATAAIKRELINEIETEWKEYKKEQREKALEEKIQQLSLRKKI
ncbi:hypothetical protein MLC52_09960 [Sulfurimonas sp. NW15]|uniref:hypothetical protein n=1 Tax=Sulfurimonas sp. NW15 TaxID=2922729 RepID=UPI003DA7DD5A